MTAPKQLPDVRKDKGYKSENEQYANRQMDHLKVADVEAAIARAYLDGAQSALRVGYLLAEEDYKKTINYYKKQIENGKH